MVRLTVGEPLEAAGVAVTANVLVPVIAIFSVPLADARVEVSLGAYFALIGCTPGTKPALLIEADPPDSVTAVPKAVAPSKSCTEPFTVAVPEGVTVMEKAMFVPLATLVLVTVIFVVVAAGGGGL
jgi:hypothetical protein